MLVSFSFSLLGSSQGLTGPMGCAGCYLLSLSPTATAVAVRMAT